MTVLENSVSVLRCFAEGRTELTVTDASQLLGLPKSNVSRLLRSMRDVGLLDDALASRGYRPGVLLLESGQSMPTARDLVALEEPTYIRRGKELDMQNQRNNPTPPKERIDKSDHEKPAFLRKVMD